MTKKTKSKKQRKPTLEERVHRLEFNDLITTCQFEMINDFIYDLRKAITESIEPIKTKNSKKTKKVK